VVSVLAAPKPPKKELTDYEKALIWKMYEIFRGPDEEARLRKVAELTEWDLRTVKKVVAEGPRLWVAVPAIEKAPPPKPRVRVGEEIFPPEEMPPEEMAIDLGALSTEELERLKKEIDEELRRRGYLAP
jgi:hypothetical protein